MFCVRGPRWSTGTSFVQGSIASQSQRTCLQLRSLVRSSSSWRCGSQRLKKERSCKVCACSPARDRKAGDGVLPVAEDTWSLGRIQPFGKGSQHHCDLVERGFQTIQGGVATSSERGAAGLTAKGLDPLSIRSAWPCVPSPKRRVNVSIGDSRVRTLSVRTGEALGVHPLRCSPAAFHLMPGAHRRRRWLHTGRESGGEATGWTIAWGAWRCRRRWTAVCNATVLEWGGQ
jgi:hypothetical protein